MGPKMPPHHISILRNSHVLLLIFIFMSRCIAILRNGCVAVSDLGIVGHNGVKPGVGFVSESSYSWEQLTN